MNKRHIGQNLFLSFLFIFGTLIVSAQTGEFTYQGKLNDGVGAANGNYDFQFELHNSASSTTPLATLTRTNVTVVGGVFTVRLNFSPALFDGTNRFLKISVKLSGLPDPFTALMPYQQVTSAPYSYKSLSSQNALNAQNVDLAANADRLGGITADQYILTTDVRLSDARTPLPNSPNYIQNSTTPQTSSNFNISGTGTANVFNASQYNIGGNRAFVALGGGLLSVFVGLNSGTSITNGFGNTFVGHFSGNANQSGSNNSFFGTDAGCSTTGNGNSFFGRSAGYDTTTGNNNAFFGLDAGRFNITGSRNAFFGTLAGYNNMADDNSFFGYSAGLNNTTGNSNAFFGNSAGLNNTTGFANSFFGSMAGQANTTGTFNAFFGNQSGFSNTTGFANSFFGVRVGQSNTTGTFNAFFGHESGNLNTTGDFNAFFGSDAGSNNSTGDNNSFFGNNAGNRNTTGFANSSFGRSAGFSNTTGINNSSFGTRAGVSNTTGNENSFLGWQAGQTNTIGSNNTLIGVNADVSAGNLNFATALGSGSTVASSNTIALGRANGSDAVLIYGSLRLNTFGSAGSTQVCVNASSILSTCSSSLRYKNNVRTFNGGLQMLRRFRPVTFDWKADGTRDIGFVAEEVNAIEPLLTTFTNGQIEGVKYAQITTVLVNAVNEQQEIIERQQKQIDALKKLVCAQNPTAEICKEEK